MKNFWEIVIVNKTNLLTILFTILWKLLISITETESLTELKSVDRDNFWIIVL